MTWLQRQQQRPNLLADEAAYNCAPPKKKEKYKKLLLN